MPRKVKKIMSVNATVVSRSVLFSGLLLILVNELSIEVKGNEPPSTSNNIRRAETGNTKERSIVNVDIGRNSTLPINDATNSHLKEKGRKIISNMIELDAKRILSIEIEKAGGGLGATDSEIILVTGDGQLRVLNIASGEVSKVAISLPTTNEALAQKAAKDLDPMERAEKAEYRVKRWHRYNDILVFDDNRARYLVLSYSYFEPGGSCFSHKVSILATPLNSRLSEIIASPQDWQIVFSSLPCFPFRQVLKPYAGHQAGGRIDVLEEATGDIVLALGDYEFDGYLVPNYPQSADVDYGKTIKINIHNKTKKILSIGHRNPQGIKVGPAGRIWLVEHGPQGGDELNLIEPGNNYGWPINTLGIMYGDRPWPLNEHQGRHDEFTVPMFAWIPSIGTSNIDVSENFHPFWEGDLLVFAMGTKGFYRVRIQNNRTIFSEQIDFGYRIRYGLSHPVAGALYLWTDSGILFEVIPSADSLKLEEDSRGAYETHKNGLASIGSSTKNALSRCLECHSGSATKAPPLSNVFMRKIGSTQYSHYTRALTIIGGVWDEENLRAYLRDPQNFAPGTNMPDLGIKEENRLHEIIDALKEL
jgi:aldose sugar dehydrogenase